MKPNLEVGKTYVVSGGYEGDGDFLMDGDILTVLSHTEEGNIWHIEVTGADMEEPEDYEAPGDELFSASQEYEEVE